MIVLAETVRVVDAVDSWTRLDDLETLHIRDAVDSWIALDDIERIQVRETLIIERVTRDTSRMDP